MHTLQLTSTEAEQLLSQTGYASLAELNIRLHELSVLARHAIDNQHWTDAQEAIRQVLKLKPDHIIALNDQVYIHMQLGLYDQAYQQCSALLAKYPDFIAGRDSMVALCNKMNRFEEALYHAKQSMVLKIHSVADSPRHALPASPPPGISRDKTRNIISYSLFGQQPRYGEVAVLNAQLAQTIYPHWTCRFYLDETVPSHTVQRLEKLGAQIHIMPVATSRYAGLFWRFLVMDDPDVDCFMIRDADSLLSYKEQAAVQAWLASGKWFHLMRDAIGHNELILAGMWGGYTGAFSHIAETIRTYLDTLSLQNRSIDQDFLRHAIYPTVAQSMLVHDNRNLDGASQPFPDYVLSDIEKIPFFHIGMIDASGSLVTHFTPTDPQATRIRWYLADENKDIVCQYEAPVPLSGKIQVNLPTFYTLNIQQGLWQIFTETIERK